MTLYIFGLVFLELFVVAWIDFKTKKISNKWSLLNVLVAIILYVFFKSYYELDWEIFIFPVGFVVIGFFLFLVNIMGAGDSKYLASLFLIIPLEYHFIFFEKIIITTIVLGSIHLAFKIIKNFFLIKSYALTRHWPGIRDLIRSQISYAPVILMAWILLGANVWQ